MEEEKTNQEENTEESVEDEESSKIEQNGEKGEENKETNKEESPDVKDNKMVALLSYFFILCLVPLLTKKESQFAQFHAKQGLVLAVGWFFTWVPFIGLLLGVLLSILSIVGILNVLNGEKKKLPIIGDLAGKFNL